MENNTPFFSSPSSPQPSPAPTPIPTPPPKRRLSSERSLLLVLALVFGFIGGRLSQIVPLHFSWFEGKMPPGVIGSSSNQKNLVSSTEEEATINIVSKNSPAVVSIVISKDVPKLRQFNISPGFPFFSDPFSLGDPLGGQSPSTPRSDNGNSGNKEKIGSGSGFFVSSDGLIVTNKHVVTDGEADYTVITNDGKEYPAKVLARDPNNDIAVLKIEGNNFPALALGDSDALKVGQTAIAIGNPLGQFANSVSRGIISGLERSVTAGSDFSGETEELSNIIQTDAAINPGNSGGPLLDLSGNVIGINVAVAQGAENIGFAIPVNSIKRVVEQVKTTGKITTPFIGVHYVIVTNDLAKQNNLPYTYGALILRGNTMTDLAVVPGSPADKAGLVENDIILEADGVKIDADHTLAKVVGNKNVGDTVTLKVWHKGEIKDITVTLEERK